MGLLFKFLAVTTAATFAAGQSFDLSEKCPDVPTMADFDMQRFLGKWYEVERTPLLWDLGARCTVHSLSQDFLIQKLEYKSVNAIFNGRQATSFNVLPGSLQPRQGAFFAIHFLNNNIPLPVPYNIIDTDYTTYALTGACVNVFSVSIRLAFVYSRVREPDDSFFMKVHSIMEAKNMTTNGMMRTSQSGCPKE